MYLKSGPKVVVQEPTSSITDWSSGSGSGQLSTTDTVIRISLADPRDLCTPCKINKCDEGVHRSTLLHLFSSENRNIRALIYYMQRTRDEYDSSVCNFAPRCEPRVRTESRYLVEAQPNGMRVKWRIYIQSVAENSSGNSREIGEF